MTMKPPNLSFLIRENRSAHPSIHPSQGSARDGAMSAYFSLQMPGFPHHLLSSAVTCFIICVCVCFFSVCLREVKVRASGSVSRVGELILKLPYGSCEWSDIKIHENLQPLQALERCLSKNR